MILSHVFLLWIELVFEQHFDKFYQMAELVFTSQTFSPNQHLNPSRQKLKARLRKNNQRQAHNRTQSLDPQNYHNNCCCVKQSVNLQELKQLLSGHSAMLQQIKQYLKAEVPRGVHGPSTSQVEELQQKNQQLRNELQSKDHRIDTLRERYEQLLMKFDNITSQSKQSSINTSFDSNTNRSLSVSRKSDIIKQLKKLKERLKNINLQQVFAKINRIGPKSE